MRPRSISARSCVIMLKLKSFTKISPSPKLSVTWIMSAM